MEGLRLRSPKEEVTVPIVSGPRMDVAAIMMISRALGSARTTHRRAKCRALALALALLLLSDISSILLAQTCANSACQACNAAYANALLGCALSGGGGCAWVYGWYQGCLASASTLPTPTPAPPSAPTPCSTGGGGLEARPRSQERSSKQRTMGGGTSSVPCAVLVDPISDLINEAGTDVTNDPVLLATEGTVVTGTAADAASRLLIRIYANSPGDQLTVTLSGDGQGNPNGLPQPFGYVQTLLPGDGGVSGSQLTLTAVDTGAGAMAFAVYHPPSSFSRGGADNSSASRVVTITINTNATAAQFSTPIYLLRPPVVLVHGIWGSFGDWLPFTFDPLALQLQSDSPNIGQFFTEIADYASPLPGVVINGACPTNCPQYSASTLSLSPVLSNSMGFSFNAPSVLKQIANAINDYRANKNRYCDASRCHCA